MRVFPANKHEEQRICAASTDKYISDREMLKNFLILFDNRMHAFVKFITGISISLNDEEMWNKSDEMHFRKPKILKDGI